MSTDGVAIIALAVVVVVTLAVVAGLHLQERREWRVILTDQQALVRDLLDRLVRARQEGAVLPDRPLVPEPIEEPPTPLPVVVEEWMEQWEDPTAREKWRAIARQYLDTGVDAVNVLKRLEERLGKP